MAKKRDRLIGHVVSHTHWDRAWYLPFELFRVRLVILVRKLLDIMEKDRTYKFCFDGQTVPLEDYLAVHPEDRPRIEKLVREKRLHVGPFYCIPDQYLVSSESLIRNIAIGMKQARAFGRCQMAGMLSDVFGHPAQVPQILAGFGMRSAIFVRGLTAEEKKRGWVQKWVAPDRKHHVTMYFLPGRGYASLYMWGDDAFDPQRYPNIPPDAREYSVELATRHVETALAEYAKGGMTTRQLWFGNGVDHQEAQPNTPALIREVNKTQDRVRLIHSTYEDMMNAVSAEKRRLPEICGQFRLGLEGTMTSRVYQKQAYTRIAARIEALTEPLLLLSELYGAGHREFREREHSGYTLNPGQNWAAFPEYPAGQMEYLWKLLLKNSPHDDICGCSVDATHQDMDNRFKRAAEISEYLARDAMLITAGRFAAQRQDAETPMLVAFNPNGFARRERETVTLFIEGLKSAAGLAVVDSDGAAVPCVVDRARRIKRRMFDGNEFAKEGVDGMEVTLSMLPRLPACSFATFDIVTDGKATAPAPVSAKAATASMKGNAAIVETEFQKVAVRANGTFDVYDKKTRRGYKGLGLLEDVEDVGDEYTYRRFERPSRPFTSRAAKGSVKIVSHDAISTCIEAQFRMRVPAEVAPGRTARSRRTVACDVRMRFDIPHYRNGGRMRVSVDNSARDHEMFVVFPTGLKAAKFEYDSKFNADFYDVGERVARIDSCALFREGKAGFGVVGDCPTLAFTGSDRAGKAELRMSVFRSVDHVYGGIPREVWGAEEGQCLRTIDRVFEWATGEYKDVRRHCLDMRRAIHAGSMIIPVTPWERLRYADMPHAKLAPHEESIVSIDGDDVHLSAWKKADDGRGWIVRVYSLADRGGWCSVRFGAPVASVSVCELDEKPTKTLKRDKSGAYTFSIASKEIVTLRMTVGARAGRKEAREREKRLTSRVAICGVVSAGMRRAP